MPEIAKIIIGSVSALIAVISVITGLIIHFSKNKKVKENAEKALYWIKYVEEYVKEAEKLVNTPGIKKKEFVINMIDKVATKNNIKYDKEKISDMIESVVSKLGGKNENIEGKQS